MPSSSSKIVIRNSGSSFITLTVHHSPFKEVNQLGTLVVAPGSTPSLYILLQAVTSTPIYTMEVNNSFGRIEKFNGRPCTISLKEFKETFSTMVCEFELKYGANYIEASPFKQLAHYVHYEALDVYEQHFPRILGVTQIPIPSYAITRAHHVIVPNNPNLVLTSVNLPL
jgi:hypothetical protein